MKRLFLLPCFSVHFEFDEVSFDVIQCEQNLTITKDDNNYAIITLKNQQVAYKANILGGFSIQENLVGKLNYRDFFRIEWQDDHATPEVIFHKSPNSIRRNYQKGMKIELGIEDVVCYHVIYKDNITADFLRTGDQSYNFTFSTGFKGSLWKDADGSHLIKFRGIRLDADEDGYVSESKFIISRSKYTDNLILILQDDAEVHLRDV